jgi:N-methylhydantoinase B
MTDSGGAGKFRGGSGTAWEVEPLNDEMTFITFGEGRRIPAVGAAGAASTMIDTKVGRLELVKGGASSTIRENVIEVIRPGDRITNMNPGGGGYGDPMERPVEMVLADLRNKLVSVTGAREDYGVVVDDPAGPTADLAATRALRAARREAAE